MSILSTVIICIDFSGVSLRAFTNTEELGSKSTWNHGTPELDHLIQLPLISEELTETQRGQMIYRRSHGLGRGRSPWDLI